MELEPQIPRISKKQIENLTVIEVDVRPCVEYMQIPPGQHSLIPDNLLFNIGSFFLFYWKYDNI